MEFEFDLWHLPESDLGWVLRQDLGHSSSLVLGYGFECLDHPEKGFTNPTMLS